MKYSLVKLVFIFVIILFMISCVAPGKYTPPDSTFYKPNKIYIFDAPFDLVWNATIRYFAARNWSVERMDKASGYIQSHREDWRYDEAKKYVDCGSQEYGSLTIVVDDVLPKYNILFTQLKGGRVEMEITMSGQCKWGAFFIYPTGKYDPYRAREVLRMRGLNDITRGVSTGLLEKELAEEIARNVNRLKRKEKNDI